MRGVCRDFCRFARNMKFVTDGENELSLSVGNVRSFYFYIVISNFL